MTHDELLAKTNYEIDLELRGMDAESWHAGARALRAVVELHKPESWDISEECECEENCGIVDFCSSCDDALYPCPTIQAIVRELA